MAAKNAFALLRLQDGEEPEKALEKNVEKYQQDIEQAKLKAKAPKHEKPQAKESNTTGQSKPRNNADKPRRDQGEQRQGQDRRAPRENGERGERRGPGRGSRREDEPARRDDGAKHRERPEGQGNRAPRRDNDRKSQSGRRPQDAKGREESKLNLGKQAEAENDAAEDVAAEQKADAEPAGGEEPAEPKEVTLTLAEFKAANQGSKASVRRQAGDGEDQSSFKKGEKVESTDDMNIVDSTSVSAQAKSKKKKAKATKESKTVDLKLNFYQHDRSDERPPRRESRESRAPGSERAPREDKRSSAPRGGDSRGGDNRARTSRQSSRGGASARTPDFNNDAAFPALG